jgi:hypothetical protein
LLSLLLDAFPDDNEMSDEAPSLLAIAATATTSRQTLVVPPVARIAAVVAAASRNEERRQARTLVVPPAANMPSSLATAASTLHRERDHEDEMDATTFGETAHLKRKGERDEKADDRLFNSLIHGVNSYDWDDEN